MKYVLNLEVDREDGSEVLGPFVGVNEDTVEYEAGTVGVRRAPADCVTVVEVPREFFLKEAARFARILKHDITWVGGDTTTAMNGLLALGIQMVEFAQMFGAQLSVDGAYAELRRTAREGRHIAGYNRHEEIREALKTEAVL